MALQMGFGLIQEQRMKLVMTPELRQAIQLLQFSATDLLQHIQQEMIENPVLEIEEVPLDHEIKELENFYRYINKGNLYYPSRGTSIEQEDPFYRVAAGAESLAEVLETQLCDYNMDTFTRKVLQYLIGNLDEKGYLDLDYETVCKRFRITEDKWKECLGILHSLDPAGVGARSLSECLVIQLKRKMHPNYLAIEIAERFLHEVADGKWKKIARVLMVDVTDVQIAVDEIKNCNPRPGGSYSSAPPRYVQPDIYVEKVDGEYVILLNESNTPRLKISAHYHRLLSRQENYAQEANAYLKNMMQSALWLVKGIEQRRDTIYRVAEAIVSNQQAFFEKGLDYLKPLTLKQIAEEIGMHESTISRVTQHKYMQTPRGLFPFRFFFPSGLATETGGELSAKTVKHKIQQMIADEDKSNPLSDQKISDLLKMEGIRISRRTVAKYREELKIASSAVRKRY